MERRISFLPVEIAAQKRDDGHAMVPEVCIFFKRNCSEATGPLNTTQRSSVRSVLPITLPLQKQESKSNTIHTPSNTQKNGGQKLEVCTRLGTDVAILKIFPGIEEKTGKALLNIPGLRAVILETYGRGNAPSLDWLLKSLTDAVAKDIIILNITQCPAGSVSMESYACGARLKKAGVLSGLDMTTEAALTKIMLLTGLHSDNKKVRELLTVSLSGEF